MASTKPEIIKAPNPGTHQEVTAISHLLPSVPQTAQTLSPEPQP